MNTQIATSGAPYAIHRYPTDLIDRVVLTDGRSVLVRPVLPQDAPLQQAFVQSLSPRARRWRFHGPVAELPAGVARYMTEIDYDDHLALLAEVFENGRPRQVAEARWVRRQDAPAVADFAIAVDDGWQRVGLGSRLMQRLVDSAGERGINELVGDIMVDNVPMRIWLQTSGWELVDDPLDATTVSARRQIAEPMLQAA